MKSSRRFALLAATLLGASAALADDPGSSESGDRGLQNLPIPLSSVVSDDYLLEPFDLVIFELRDEPDASTQLRLSGKGEMRLPMLGSVSLMGLSVRAAEEEIEKKYRDGGYFVRPQVTLYVAQHAERTIAVLGQVNRPDRFPLVTGTESMGLAQAVAMAGGLTRIAKANEIQISRIGSDGHEQRFVVNLDEYLDSEKTGRVSDFKLLPGDIVFVPERAI